MGQNVGESSRRSNLWATNGRWTARTYRPGSTDGPC